MMYPKVALLALLASTYFVSGQFITEAPVQTTSWNSTFALSPDQVKLANLTDDSAKIISQIVNFDRTLLANGGPYQDDFYTLPEDLTPPIKGGKLLKLQEVADPGNYTIPATTAMSRFIYSTTNFNGTVIPASAYVLWPYQAKQIPGANGRVPTILWTHGTAGWAASQAPSAHRSLFYGDIMPYALALAGYAVVAPDYAGLGVGKSWDGSEVPHQYALYTVGAGDALHALRAAFEAFPDRLTSRYVNIGHSQGGVISWGVAEGLAQPANSDLAKTHLGSIVFGPQPNPFALAPELLLGWVGKYLTGVFPTFNISAWLTPLGINRLEVFNEIEGGQFVAQALFEPGNLIVQPDWNTTWAVKAFSNVSIPGNKPYKGPMLFIQGDKDPAVQFNDVQKLFNSTCARHPGDMQLIRLPNVGHFSALLASRGLWLDWVEDRFNGQALLVEDTGCVQTTLWSYLNYSGYQTQVNNFPMWAGEEKWAWELPQNA
jgi:hypothetical protein